MKKSTKLVHKKGYGLVIIQMSECGGIGRWCVLLASAQYVCGVTLLKTIPNNTITTPHTHKYCALASTAHHLPMPLHSLIWMITNPYTLPMP